MEHSTRVPGGVVGYGLCMGDVREGRRGGDGGSAYYVAISGSVDCDDRDVLLSPLAAVFSSSRGASAGIPTLNPKP